MDESEANSLDRDLLVTAWWRVQMIASTTLKIVAICINVYFRNVTCTHSVSCLSNVIFIKYNRASFAVEVIAGHIVWHSANRSREWALLCTGRETNIDRNSGLWFHSSSRLFALHSTSYYVHAYQLEIRNTWINDVALQLLGPHRTRKKGRFFFLVYRPLFSFWWVSGSKQWGWITEYADMWVVSFV